MLRASESKLEEVAALNEALASRSEWSATWWSYSASLRTFELVIGEPDGDANIVVVLSNCTELSGPTSWSKQHIRAEFLQIDNLWSFKLIDSSVGFVAHSNMLAWRRNFDLVARGSLVFSSSAKHANESPNNVA